MKLRNKIVALVLTVASAFGLAVANKNVTKVEAAGSYTQVTSTDELSAGDVILFANKTNNAVAGALSTTSTKYLTKVDVTIDDTTITVADEAVLEFTVEVNPDNAAQYAFKTDSGYLAWSSGNSAAFNTSAYYWTLSFGTDDVSITSVATTARRLRYNSANPRFACYTSAQAAVQIYKVGAAVELTDAEKVAQAANSLEIASELMYNTMLPTTGRHDSTVTWASNNAAIVVDANGSATVTRGTEDVTVTLTATITLNAETTTKDYTVVVKAVNANEPVVGTEYKLMLTQGTLGTDLYFAGTMSGYYFATTETYNEGANIVLEVAPYDGYYMSMTDSTGTKKYINITVSGSYNNVTIDDTASSAWAYNSTYDTLTTVANGTTFFLGAYGSYSTISASNITFLATSTTNYPTHLVEAGATVAEQIAALETMAQFGVDYTCVKGIQTTATLTFDDAAKRTTSTTEEQVWTENGITLTYTKNNYSNNLAEYANPLRVYKGTKVVISSETTFSQITINTPSSSHAFPEGHTIAGATVSVTSTVTTITLDTPATSFDLGEMPNQVRISSLEVLSGTPDSYTDFTNAKMRFVGIIPADLATEVASAGVTLTMGTTTKNYDATLVGETDADKSFAVVLSEIPAEQYATEITATAYVVLTDGTTVNLQSKTYSIDTIVQYYLDNAANLNLNAVDIAILTAFQNA